MQSDSSSKPVEFAAKSDAEIKVGRNRSGETSQHKLKGFAHSQAQQELDSLY